ncbi:hypothetical protein CDAR_235881 [Caerostris darwini]|uniref:Uncharacterized protein n=1 Tax=Caerostris darwini TaxID=1538125 RepID=A0AAV4PQX4_9ARAC|nr:hypothetical protein CDAR_235881 [Caerostris darwini]
MAWGAIKTLSINQLAESKGAVVSMPREQWLAGALSWAIIGEPNFIVSIEQSGVFHLRCCCLWEVTVVKKLQLYPSSLSWACFDEVAWIRYR